MKQIIRQIALSTLAVTVVCLTSGCSTIVTGTHKKVTFKSNPEGAKVTVVNAKGKTVAEGTTPFTAKLLKGKPYFAGQRYTLTFSKEGYCDATQEIKSSFNGWYMGNLFFGGLMGLLVVDPLTGAVYTLPDQVSVKLTLAEGSGTPAAELRIMDWNDVPPPLRMQLVRLN